MYEITFRVRDFFDERDNIPVGVGGISTRPGGVNDLEIATIDGTRYVLFNTSNSFYTITSSNDGLLEYVTGYPTFGDDPSGSYNQGSLHHFTFQENSFLGVVNDTFSINPVSNRGHLESRTFSIDDVSSTKFNNAVHGDHWEDGGEHYFAALSRDERGFTIIKIEPDGVVQPYATSEIDRSFSQEFFYGDRWKTLNYDGNDIVRVGLGEATFIYTSIRESAGIVSYALSPQGEITQIDLDIGQEGFSSGFTGNAELHAVKVGGQNYLIHYSGSDLYVYTIQADGTLNKSQEYVWNGFGFNGNIESFSYAGRTFILLPDSDSRQDGGLGLYEMGSDGELTKVVHLATKFSNGGFESTFQNFEVFLNGSELIIITGEEISKSLMSMAVDLSNIQSDDTNYLTGTDANDVLIATLSNDVIDGGMGYDTALYSGDQSSYTLTLSPTSTTVTDRRADGNGTDTLIDMEFLDFDTEIPALGGNPLNLDMFGGSAELSADEFSELIELYIAYFNRAPDAMGLNFWATAYSNGQPLEEIATLFLDQEETRALYPEGTSNAVFLENVYQNVLGRDFDQEGFDFWLKDLNSDAVGRDEFILNFLDGAQGSDVGFLEDKVKIGTYFAVTKGMSDGDNATDAMALFGDQVASDINGAVAAIDDFYTDALDPTDGEFLMPLVGVLDDPFAVA